MLGLNQHWHNQHQIEDFGIWIWILKKIVFENFNRSNGDMVRVGDKHMFRFNSKDYTIEKTITNCQQP
jgi:hypothetical protein